MHKHAHALSFFRASMNSLSSPRLSPPCPSPFFLPHVALCEHTCITRTRTCKHARSCTLMHTLSYSFPFSPSFSFPFSFSLPLSDSWFSVCVLEHLCSSTRPRTCSLLLAREHELSLLAPSLFPSLPVFPPPSFSVRAQRRAPKHTHTCVLQTYTAQLHSRRNLVGIRGPDAARSTGAI